MAFAFIKDTHINFVGMRHFAYGLSALLIIIGLLSCIWGNGLRPGIDFAGGVIAQVEFAQPVPDDQLKEKIAVNNLPGLSTQRFGNEGKSYLLRFAVADQSPVDLRQSLETALAQGFPGNTSVIQRMEVVGPKVGADLTNKALSALCYSILIIAVYISGRFEQRWMVAALMAAALWGGIYCFSLTGLSMGWLAVASLCMTVALCFFLKLNFALGAIVGLMHDVLITVGLLSLCKVDMDLNVLAAILSLIGYSLNDTIIVYDRLRENLRAYPGEELGATINRSVNQTLSRTILTSGTTLLATLALFLFGGGVIHDFALTMLFGVFIGTFSSVFVSSAILLAFGNADFYAAKCRVEQYERPGPNGII